MSHMWTMWQIWGMHHLGQYDNCSSIQCLRRSCIILVNCTIVVNVLWIFQHFGFELFCSWWRQDNRSLLIFIYICGQLLGNRHTTLHRKAKHKIHRKAIHNCIAQPKTGAWELGKLGSLCLVLLSGKDNLLSPWFFWQFLQVAITLNCLKTARSVIRRDSWYHQIWWGEILAQIQVWWGDESVAARISLAFKEFSLGLR